VSHFSGGTSTKQVLSNYKSGGTSTKQVLTECISQQVPQQSR